MNEEMESSLSGMDSIDIDSLKEMSNELSSAAKNIKEINKQIQKTIKNSKTYSDALKRMGSSVSETGKTNNNTKESTNSKTGTSSKNSNTGKKEQKEKKSNKDALKNADKYIKAASGILGSSGQLGVMVGAIGKIAPVAAVASIGITELSKVMEKSVNNTYSYARALQSMGESLTKSDKTAISAKNNINKLANQFSNAWAPIEKGFTWLVDKLAGGASALLSAVGVSSEEPEKKTAPVKADIVTSAKQSGFDAASARNLGQGTLDIASSLTEITGEQSSEIAKKLGEAWLTGSDAAKEYGAVLNDNVLAGYLFEKGIDIVNVEITEAQKQLYRYELLQEELKDVNSDTTQSMIKKWTQLGIQIDKAKGKLFSFDEVLQLSAVDTTIPEVGDGIEKPGQNEEKEKDKKSDKTDNKPTIPAIIPISFPNGIKDILDKIFGKNKEKEEVIVDVKPSGKLKVEPNEPVSFKVKADNKLKAEPIEPVEFKVKADNRLKADPIEPVSFKVKAGNKLKAEPIEPVYFKIEAANKLKADPIEPVYFEVKAKNKLKAEKENDLDIDWDKDVKNKEISIDIPEVQIGSTDDVIDYKNMNREQALEVLKDPTQWGAAAEAHMPDWVKKLNQTLLKGGTTLVKAAVTGGTSLVGDASKMINGGASSVERMEVGEIYAGSISGGDSAVNLKKKEVHNISLKDLANSGLSIAGAYQSTKTSGIDFSNKKSANIDLKMAQSPNTVNIKKNAFANGGIGTQEIHNATLFEGNKKEAVIPLESQEGISFLANAMQQASGGENGIVGDNIVINMNMGGLNVSSDTAQWDAVARKIAERIDIQRARRGELNYGSSF